MAGVQCSGLGVCMGGQTRSGRVWEIEGNVNAIPGRVPAAASSNASQKAGENSGPLRFEQEADEKGLKL